MSLRIIPSSFVPDLPNPSDFCDVMVYPLVEPSVSIRMTHFSRVTSPNRTKRTEKGREELALDALLWTRLNNLEV
jgi:hypothetical protein